MIKMWNLEIVFDDFATKATLFLYTVIIDY